MPRRYTIVLALFWLSACGGLAAQEPASAPVAPTAPATQSTLAPPAMASAPVAPTAPATQSTLAPTAPPAPATAAPTAPPAPATAAPTAPPATAAIGALPSVPLDPQAQAAALLPELAGDLERAPAWNRYTISAAIDPQAREIGGRLRLEYTNHDYVSLDRLYFHLYPNLRDFGGSLKVRNLALDGASSEVLYESGGYLLRVNLPKPLDPASSTTVAFDWTASAPENASGERYGAFNKEIGVLSLASSFPIAAIVRGGNWDIELPDPKGDFVNSETALFDVTLAAPAGWALATTGVVLDARQEGGQQIARMVSGPQRDFMITLSQFARSSAEVGGTRINSYYRAADADGGKAALEAAANALRVFNKRYGAYPLRELDVVELAASTFLGVEYPGLVEIEQRLYTNPDGLEITVAHEVAHQWWYSQVGNDVQTASWLDEALASYSQIVYQEELYGPAAAERELDEFRQRYRTAIADGRDAPVEQPNSAFKGNYVNLVYGKGVLFFAALRKQIGETAFDRFLHEHYAKHRYGYISGGDLLADAEGACTCDLHALYSDWITHVAPVEVP